MDMSQRKHRFTVKITKLGKTLSEKNLDATFGGPWLFYQLYHHLRLGCALQKRNHPEWEKNIGFRSTKRWLCSQNIDLTNRCSDLFRVETSVYVHIKSPPPPPKKSFLPIKIMGLTSKGWEYERTRRVGNVHNSFQNMQISQKSWIAEAHFAHFRDVLSTLGPSQCAAASLMIFCGNLGQMIAVL